MPFGHLTETMAQTIRTYVEGKRVWDLGSGDFHYARELLLLGADSVLAIDKEWRGRPPEGVTFRQDYFFDITPEPIEVAFISWPANYNLTGLIEILEQAQTVIYLGCNLDGSACGWKGLFEHLTGRELLAHVPHRRNTLLVCGRTLDVPREPTGEERGGLTTEGLTFDGVYLTS